MATGTDAEGPAPLSMFALPKNIEPLRVCSIGLKFNKYYRARVQKSLHGIEIKVEIAVPQSTLVVIVVITGVIHFTPP